MEELDGLSKRVQGRNDLVQSFTHLRNQEAELIASFTNSIEVLYFYLAVPLHIIAYYICRRHRLVVVMQLLH
jgi:hypothetical protein